ncbi:LysR substrate-binding domain-containing protein [Leucobacter sp. gxy201]|uniref:LysR family transcriptional regulator n=1 Tax=Leucobacter sp. gxy201 TaxID=2957200 RepID=UPI003DA14F90
MLDTGKLVLLREVSLRGSVTAAAASLGVSPSNISQRLSRLERECGVPLLESEGRGVRLSAAAVRLVEHTEQILEVLERASSELESPGGAPSGTVRLVGFHTFAIGMLASATRALHRDAPGLRLEFVQLDPEAAVDRLLARRADIAVADEYPGHPLPPSPGLRGTVLGKEPIQAYLPAGVDDPAAAVWAMEPRASDSFRWSRGICRAAGFEPRVQFESPDPYVHRRLVEQGVAAAFLPAGVAAGLHAPVAPVSGFPDDMHRRHVTLIRRGTERSRAVAACLAALRTAWGEVWGAADQPIV